MRAIIRSVVSAALLIAGAAAAYAGDVIVDAPTGLAADATAHDWTGLYAGITLGTAIAAPDATAPDMTTLDLQPSAQIGYNWQLDDNLVFGVEGQLTHFDDKAQ